MSAGSAFGSQAPYPSHPITLIVGSAAGSGADLLCRLVAQALQESLGQPVIVENRPGAAGSLAALTVVRSRPDGYTLFFGSASSTVVSQAAQRKPAFDPGTDLAAIAQIGVGGVPLVVTRDFPASTMTDFIALVKAHPGRYQYATWGVGTTGQLIMEWLKSRTGMRIDAVPYQSIPAIVHDMLSGVIDVGFLDAGTAAPLVKGGRLKALGVSGSRRSPAMPDVALMREQGVKFEIDGWYGLFAPKGTPGAIVDRLNREIAQVLAKTGLRERLAQLNVANTPAKSPSQFAKTVHDDFLAWRQIVISNNIDVE